MSIRRGPQRLASTLCVLIMVAACQPQAPTGSPATPASPSSSTTAEPSAGQSSPSTASFAQIRADVEAIRGLEPTADVEPVIIDADQLRTNLQAEFDKENKPEDLRFSEQALIALGLLPDGASLRALTLDLQAGQVAGYYSPDRNELFVVSRTGTFGVADEVTYAHEFTHQLQDQTFDLDKFFVDAANQSDRALAQLALIEGDASSVQTSWIAANLSPEEIGELLRASLDPEGLAALQRAPAYLRETSLFPYQDGLVFATGLVSGGGYAAVDAAFADPPASTEQVLHPEKYAAREAPRVVKIPQLFDPGLPAGWKALGQDTLGEFLLRLWLTQGGVLVNDARTATAGWGGDRLEVYESPNGISLLLVTEWDRLTDAAEFSAAAKAALPQLGLRGTVVFDERSPTVYVALGDDAHVIEPTFFG